MYYYYGDNSIDHQAYIDNSYCYPSFSLLLLFLRITLIPVHFIISRIIIIFHWHMHATLVCGHFMHGHIYNKYEYVIYKISIYIYLPKH